MFPVQNVNQVRNALRNARVLEQKPGRGMSGQFTQTTYDLDNDGKADVRTKAYDVQTPMPSLNRLDVVVMHKDGSSTQHTQRGIDVVDSWQHGERAVQMSDAYAYTYTSAPMVRTAPESTAENTAQSAMQSELNLRRGR